MSSRFLTGNLCQNVASTSTTTPRPTTPACVDKSANCPNVARQGFCQSYYYVGEETVLEYCPFSCGNCNQASGTTREPCLDTQPKQCEGIAAMNLCGTLSDKNICKKSDKYVIENKLSSDVAKQNSEKNRYSDILAC